MKILIPIISFGRAGGFRVLAKLANSWKSDGHDVHFVVYNKQIDPYYPVNAPVFWINNSGCIVDRSNNREQQLRIFSLWSIFQFLRNNIGNYDLVVANWNLTAYPVAIVAKEKGCYYVQAYEPELICHANYSPLGKIVLFILAKFSYQLPIRKIVNSSLYKNYKGIHTNHVIHPGIDFNIFYSRRYYRSENFNFTVGCIGRKESWKGSHDVEIAVERLQNEGLNIKLKAAFFLMNSNRHELVMPDGDDNLADYYRHIDILVAPGHIQLGAVHYPVIEAMACGTPVITTGYYPADDSCAFIVKPRNIDDLVEKIRFAYKNYEVAIEKSIQAKMRLTEFNWEVLSKEFLNICEQ